MNRRKTLIFGVLGVILVAWMVIISCVVLKNNQNQTPETSTLTSENSTPGEQKPYNFDYTWAEDNFYIYHAFGSIDGKNYTNSYEAFLYNYQLGARIFEVDFELTDDGYLVTTHDKAGYYSRQEGVSEESYPFTRDNVLSQLFLGEYHLLDARECFGICQK